MTKIRVQNLSADVINDPAASVKDGLSTDVEVDPIDLHDVGESFLQVTVKWNDGRETVLAIGPDEADKLIGELVRARLGLHDKRATIPLGDLTGLRIDAAAAVISLDGISGTTYPYGGPDEPEWKLADRRGHVYGDWSCEGTSDCTPCSAAATAPATTRTG